ncbi:MAG: DUF4367 domain-containing protein [Eubacteriales bacterium]
MKINQNDKLDASIFLASNSCVRDLISEFEDLTELEADEKLRRHGLRIAKSDRRKRRIRKVCGVTKILAVALLAAISLVTTACMSVPEIRQATCKAIVTYLSDDESFEITFQLQNPDISMALPPATVEEIHAPKYMPEGYTAMVIYDPSMYFQAYTKESDGSCYLFTQTVLVFEKWDDAEEGTATEITVNGWTAVLITYEDDSSKVRLRWQDHEYCYSLSGQFDDYEQLIRIAESVETR